MMRVLTEIESQNETFLNKKGIPFVKVLMTQNILSHHIFDATQSIVKFLKGERIHDFDLQGSGEKNISQPICLRLRERRLLIRLFIRLLREGTNVCGLVRRYYQSHLLMTYI